MPLRVVVLSKLGGFLQVDAVDLVQRDTGGNVDLNETRGLGGSLEEPDKDLSTSTS